MPTFIFLNGPPRSGKDTAAGLLDKLMYTETFNSRDLYPSTDKLAAPLKRAFAGVMNVQIDTDFTVRYYEAKKESVIPRLGVSYRQWQIDFSEKFMKPMYGPNIFSQLLLDRSHRNPAEFIIVSDCGFQSEFDYVSKRAKCFLIQLHRKGCTYDGDSREYVTGNPMIKLLNDRSIADLKAELRIILTTRILPYHKS